MNGSESVKHDLISLRSQKNKRERREVCGLCASAVRKCQNRTDGVSDWFSTWSKQTSPDVATVLQTMSIKAKAARFTCQNMICSHQVSCYRHAEESVLFLTWRTPLISATDRSLNIVINGLWGERAETFRAYKWHQSNDWQYNQYDIISNFSVL